MVKSSRDSIVFLDAGTVHYGDVSFGELKRLGRFKAYSKTDPDEIKRRVSRATVVITNKCRFDAGLLPRLKTVKLIAIAATGTNNVDLEAARREGIAVTNVSGYSTETVVQFTFAFLLALAGNLVKFNEASHDGRWSRSPFFTLPDFPIQEIAGKVLGIVGYGKIGKRVAQAARAFGMKILVARIPGKDYSSGGNPKRVSVDFFLRHSDFVTLHAPLSSLTKSLIDAKALRKMKRGAFLINMARGGLVDEKTLCGALKSRRLGGAAADVLNQEPPPKGHPLLKAPNFLLTPHIAWASREARSRLLHEIALNIKAFQRGVKRNRVV